MGDFDPKPIEHRIQRYRWLLSYQTDPTARKVLDEMIEELERQLAGHRVAASDPLPGGVKRI